MASFVDRVRRRAAAMGPHATVARQSDPRKARAAKAFSMPPFWATDGARIALTSWGASPDTEFGGEGFLNAVQQMYKANGPVFSCTMARARVFNQARFSFQRMRQGRPTDLVFMPEIRILERPYLRGAAGAFLTDVEVDASTSGNNYTTMVDADGNIGRAARRDNGAYLVRMRPDWVKLIIRARSGNPFNVDAQVIALQYTPPGMDGDPLLLMPDEFAHFAPIPDPEARFRGMSWLTPIAREAGADRAYTDHKIAFLKNGATPNLVVKMSDDVEEDDFQAFVSQFKEDYEGAANAYKTLFVAGGADVVPLSIDFQQLDLKATQGHLETRICSAAGVHPVIAGMTEGLQGSSLNAGNFGAAKRLFVDTTIRDLWGQASSTFEVFAPPPPDMRLWYDARDIPFLRDDNQQEAETFNTQAQAARHLADGGWDPDAAIDAAKVSDISLLKGKHTGMLSVQLQTPGAQTAPANGSTPPVDAPTVDLGRGANGNGRQTTTGAR